ncbi:hypothetical protein LVJ82_17040 [Vitreoscilla massiliensis]|uniref:Glutamate 5-kinase n=1 Tax=Vitreoscilla massiliensis TaxID=1689272 RepID=A0ABY4E043_9NEIS|nr:hypothetical protein [Vitreoscilla massiliensis]UOO89125.1 hypothetical protein LVJ82_17040 [Vitreoscilla massiliensis]
MRSEIQTELAAAMSDDLADAAKPFTCVRETYELNKITGKQTLKERLEYSGRAVYPLGYKRDEAEMLKIQATDAKAIILQNECSAIPAVDDELVFGTQKMKVINVRQDPVAATWSLQLRKV